MIERTKNIKLRIVIARKKSLIIRFFINPVIQMFIDMIKMKQINFSLYI